MPAYNEKRFLERSLGSPLRQDCPSDCRELLVAAAMSTDGTADLAQEMAARTPIEVRVLENPEQLTAAGFNLARRHANGAIIIRVDGHCELAPDYVRRAVEELERTGADCVGGLIRTVGETRVGRVIAAVQSSRYGDILQGTGASLELALISGSLCDASLWLWAGLFARAVRPGRFSGAAEYEPRMFGWGRVELLVL